MPASRSTGFTMIELVMAIVLIGIIGAVLAPVIQNSVEIYAAERSRSALVQKGRLALERIAREVREAVPNSLTVVSDASGNTGIEFVQIKSGGRYIDITDSECGTTFLLTNKCFSSGVARTDIYSFGQGQPAVAANDLLIIANTSADDLIAGDTVTPLLGITNTTAADGGTTIGQVLNIATPPASIIFSGGSLGRRFFVANTNHEIGRVGNAVYWHSGTGLTDYNKIGNWSSADPMLVNGVANLVIDYNPGAAIGVAVLSVTLSLDDGSESIDLFREIQIRNSM